MKQQEILELVKKHFNEQFEIPLEKITLEANLFEDLELDSIDALDMVAMLEAELEIEVDEEKMKSIRTVQDVVNFVVEAMP